MATNEYKSKSISILLMRGMADHISFSCMLALKAIFTFVDETAVLPSPTIDAELTSVTAVFRRSALPGLIDMLRNEHPVQLRITTNDASPPNVTDVVVVAPDRLPGQGER